MKFKKFTLSISIIFTCLLIFWTPLAEADTGMKQMGTVTIMQKGPVTIHSFMAPLGGALVTSQIIETQNKLVIVDVQFVRSSAKAVRNYVDRLNKPVDRVIISHGHPDHWFGLEYFTDFQIYALPETKGMIEKVGDIFIKKNRDRRGDLITDKKIIPNMTIKEGKEVIDGLEYQFEKYLNAEAPAQLLIKFPALGTLVVQDLVYNNAHLVLGKKEAIDGWKKAIAYLKGMSGYSTILGGHGEPTTPAIYEKIVKYLDDASAILAASKTGDEFKQKLIAAHPTYRAPFFVNISVSRIFGAH